MTMRAIPPSHELFTIPALAARHPNFLTDSKVRWAVRQRAKNGLLESVFETRSRQNLIHEPGFLQWFLGLTGRSKPRAPRRSRRTGT